jgi:signal transduction histidine kinase
VLIATSGAVTLVLVAAADREPHSWTYGASSDPALVLLLVAGASLVAVGTSASVLHPGTATGPLLGATALSWLGAEVVGWASGPSIIRSSAMLADLLLIPFLVHLGIVYRSGGVRGPSERVLLITAYSAAGIAVLARAMFYEPIRDLSCWRFCGENAFLVTPEPRLASTVNYLWLISSVVIAFALAISLVRRMRATGRVFRSATLTVLTSIGAGVLLEGARNLLILADPVEDPAKSAFLAVFLLRGLFLIALAAAVVWDLSQTRGTRRALQNLAEHLEAETGRGPLERILAEGLGDDSLRVAYWIPGLSKHVDSKGRQLDVEQGQVTTAIERAGERLALVVHQPTLDVADLEREFGSAARLAVDNERLRAGLNAQASEIRRSRRRIVDRADHARKILERDLHDGAQQQLLAVSYQIRLARSASPQEGQRPQARLNEALDKLLTAIEEVRQLAHGIFPSVLSDSGLLSALEGLAERSELPLVVSAPDERYDPAVEMAAYLTVRESSAWAARLGARGLSASVVRTGTALELSVAVDGPRPTSKDLMYLEDRVGAVGGRVEFSDHGFTAVIPCA